MNTKETRRSKPRSKLFPSPNGKVIPLSENASELLKRQFERTHILDSRFFPEFEKESEYEHFSRMVEIMRDAEISSHIIYAYVKTGRMVTEENIQFLSEEDIDEWNHFINESEKFEGDFNNLIENALCELSTDISCPDLPKEALELLFDIYKFHPILVERCRDTFVSNIMIDTVRNGIMAILAEIKDVTGRFDLDGSDLINCVFSPNKPILETGMYSLGDINEQKGVHYIFLGFILAIRNQFFHRDIYLKNPYLVLQYLSYSKRTGKLRRSFLKTSISVDTIKKVILGWKISQKTDHDVKHA
ncbi:MAG: TIGR02391 family protein, partial [Methanosarcina flavescens]|nr:hypothetical protein [Methanosarcina flavescens]